jgi:hypothetical protein
METLGRSSWWKILIVGTVLFVLLECVLAVIGNPYYIPSLLLIGAGLKERKYTKPVSLIYDSGSRVRLVLFQVERRVSYVPRLHELL